MSGAWLHTSPLTFMHMGRKSTTTTLTPASSKQICASEKKLIIAVSSIRSACAEPLQAEPRLVVR